MCVKRFRIAHVLIVRMTTAIATGRGAITGLTLTSRDHGRIWRSRFMMILDLRDVLHRRGSRVEYLDGRNLRRLSDVAATCPT